MRTKNQLAAEKRNKAKKMNMRTRKTKVPERITYIRNKANMVKDAAKNKN